MSKTPKKVLLSWKIETTGTTGQVMLDASINEQHEHGAQVTEHNVEKGENAADHVRALPAKLTIEGMITNTPIEMPQTQADGISGGVQEVSTRIGNQEIKYSALKFDTEFDRVREVNDNFVDALEAGALWTATTTLKRYEDYVIETYSVERNAGKGNVLHFTAAFRHVRFVETQTVDALPPKKKTKNRGAKPAKPVEGKDKEKKRSVIEGFVQRVFGGGA